MGRLARPTRFCGSAVIRRRSTISRLGPIAGLLLTLAPARARAQQLWPVVLDTVNVTAPRPRIETPTRTPGFSTVIPLGEAAPPGRDVSDLLDRTAGLHVHRYGGLGAFSLASVRGSTPGQVIVCVDGAPLSSAGDGFVNLALLPVSSFEKVEVYRGPQTTSFGGPPAAGVINLVTPGSLSAPLSVSAGAGSFGTALARARWGRSWPASGGHGVWSGFVSAQTRDSRGDFPYLDRNGTYYGNTADDHVVNRENNAFRDGAVLWKASFRAAPRTASSSAGSAEPVLSVPGSFAAAASGPASTPVTVDPAPSALPVVATRASSGLPEAPEVGLDHREVPGVLGGFWVDYTGEGFARSGGVPGTESIQTQRVHFRTERLRQELSIRNLPDRRSLPELELSLHGDLIRDRYENPDGELSLPRASTDDRTTELGGALSVGDDLPLLGHSKASLEARSERWTPRDLLADAGASGSGVAQTVQTNEERSAGPVSLQDGAAQQTSDDDATDSGYTRTRFHRTLWLEDSWVRGRVTVEAAYRWAWATDNFSGDAGAAAPEHTLENQGATYGLRLDLGRGFLLRGNRGPLARFPTFPELFGQNGIQEGNPALKPERGLQWDLGLDWNPDLPVQVEAVYFENLTEDGIVLLQNSQRTTKAENLERTWTRGVEATAFGRVSLGAGASLEIQGSLTIQQALDVGPSPVYHGLDLPNLPAREAWVSVRLARGGWSLRPEVSLRSSSYRDRYNSPLELTPATIVHDLSLERALGAFVLRGEIQNLGNVQVEDIDGFPLPGRSYYMEVTWTR